MSRRLKFILCFALLGFLGGMISYITYKQLVPILVQHFPILLTTEWFLSGLAGSVFTLITLLLWTYISR